jgi:hypothetical protein
MAWLGVRLRGARGALVVALVAAGCTGGSLGGSNRVLHGTGGVTVSGTGRGGSGNPGGPSGGGGLGNPGGPSGGGGTGDVGAP